MEIPNFNILSLNEMIKWYNEAAEKLGLKRVNRFATKPRAIKRCERMAQWLNEGLDDDEVEALNTKRKRISVKTLESWQDPAVRASRSIREAVIVDGKEAFQSVRAAFRYYELLDSKHYAFRKELKAARVLKRYGHKWEIIPYADFRAAVRKKRGLED